MVSVINIVPAQRTRDGDGVLIHRSIGSGTLEQHDPFLLLDEIRSDDSADYIGGFPPHPHRGFETVTYMLTGRMRHRDSQGNHGVIESGAVQWMTAGRGILHSEMPEQTEGRLWGFQLWINLQAKEKLCAPQYQEFNATEITELPLSEHCQVRLIAGQIDDQQGPVTGIATRPLLADVRWSGATQVHLPLDLQQTSALYVYQGSVSVQGTQVPSQHLALLSDVGDLTLSTESSGGALLLSARPINEPVARYGPFVMNSQQELRQALEDLNNGKFGQLS